MPAELSRIVVVGTSCAGKSTLAQQLAERLASPHIELDALYWLADWQPRDRSDFRARVSAVLAQDCWVIDGNYGSVRELVWPRATAVLWLNYGFGGIFWRALRRTTRRVLFREQLYSGNRETARKAFFSRDSIIWWVATSYHQRRKEYRRLFDGEDYSHLAKIEFRHPSETLRFLEQIERP